MITIDVLFPLAFIAGAVIGAALFAALGLVADIGEIVIGEK